MREASTPFSFTRYSLVWTARQVASFGPSFSLLAALPVMASLAFGSRCAFRAMSSRQALASLSTRVGRFASLSKLMVQRLVVLITVGCVIGTALTVTVVCCEAVWPLSSTTLQVTVIVPGATPVV